MGQITSSFWRKKTTEDTLYKLYKEHKSLNEYMRSTKQTRRRVVGLMNAFVGLNVLAVLVFYFYYKPATWTDTLFYFFLLLITPLLLFLLLRTAILRYYDWKLTHYRTQLQVMRTEKESILDEVKKRETYNVAMGIINKFGNTNEEMEEPLIQLERPTLPYSRPERATIISIE